MGVFHCASLLALSLAVAAAAHNVGVGIADVTGPAQWAEGQHLDRPHSADGLQAPGLQFGPR